ncbi:hypothetical protein BH11MYX4_BH11MYX4_23580 [soil metagenome]
MRTGLVALAMALAFAAFLTRSDGAHLYRWFAFLPFFVAANGVLAAFYRTCGFTAAAGRRMTPEGAEPVADRDELAEQRRVGMRVLGSSAALAAVATALFVTAS